MRHAIKIKHTQQQAHKEFDSVVEQESDRRGEAGIDGEII